MRRIAVVILRPDQDECVGAIRGAWAEGVQRPAAIAPCGWGKTVAFCDIGSREIREEGNCVLVLVNRDELVDQTVEQITAADPGISATIYKGAEKNLRGEIVVASIQTMGKERNLHTIPQNRFPRIICDEAHYAAADSWVRTLKWFGGYDPESPTRVAGFTATMTRADKRGLGEVWQKIVFKRDTRWAIEMGFLVPVDAQRVQIPGLDLRDIHIRGGDLAGDELGKAMAQAEAGPFIAQSYSEYARDEHGELRRGIIFAPTVEMAESWLHDFRAAGIPTELILGTTDTKIRRQRYGKVERGESKVLMTVMVCSVGFDLPAIEVAGMGRPTKSKALYQQQAGRALRLSPKTGKKRALLLDFVGVTAIGLASIVDLELDRPEKEKDVLLDELDEKGSPIRIPADLLEVPEELIWVPVDAFDGTHRPKHLEPKPVKVPKSPKVETKGWDLTETGIPFLPPTSMFEFYIFVHEKDGVYRVGERPKGRGKPVMLGTFDSFAEAVACAEDNHPGAARPLVGFATEGQINELRRCGKAVPPMMTKDEAGKMLTKIYATRAIG